MRWRSKCVRVSRVFEGVWSLDKHGASRKICNFTQPLQGQSKCTLFTAVTTSLSFFLSHIELDPFSVARGMTLFQEQPRVQWLNGTAALVFFHTVLFHFGIATIHFHLQVSAHVMLNLIRCGLRTCRMAQSIVCKALSY